MSYLFIFIPDVQILWYNTNMLHETLYTEKLFIGTLLISGKYVYFQIKMTCSKVRTFIASHVNY